MLGQSFERGADFVRQRASGVISPFALHAGRARIVEAPAFLVELLPCRAQLPALDLIPQLRQVVAVGVGQLVQVIEWHLADVFPFELAEFDDHFKAPYKTQPPPPHVGH
jgi:hypothetical protein